MTGLPPVGEERKTWPDLDALWDTYRVMREMMPMLRYSQQPLWRINMQDWRFLLRVDTGQSVPVAEEIPRSGGRTVERRLFGLDVEVYGDDRAPAHPELVLVCDRRRFAQADASYAGLPNDRPVR